MDGLLILMTILLLSILSGLVRKHKNRICKSKKRLDGKTCLVTGGTSGMGLEIAIDFAARGAKVIVACPFEEEGTNAHKKIVEESGNKNVVFKLLDLASLRSVREFAKDILESEDRLDILMNNAGVGVPRKVTEDGMNIIMQVNYFGAFLLTILLLPLLKKSGTESEPSRIVNTSSVLHRFAKLDLNNLNKIRDNFFLKIIVYANSKLCLLLFSRELTKRLKGAHVVINDGDPGEVGTSIFLSAGYLYGCLMYLLLVNLSKSAWEGAQNTIFVAVDESAGNVSGKFFRNCQLRSPSKSACDDEAAKKLFVKSMEIVKLSDEELVKCLY